MDRTRPQIAAPSGPPRTPPLPCPAGVRARGGSRSSTTPRSYPDPSPDGIRHRYLPTSQSSRINLVRRRSHAPWPRERGRRISEFNNSETLPRSPPPEEIRHRYLPRSQSSRILCVPRGSHAPWPRERGRRITDFNNSVILLRSRPEEVRHHDLEQDEGPRCPCPGRRPERRRACRGTCRYPGPWGTRRGEWADARGVLGGRGSRRAAKARRVSSCRAARRAPRPPLFHHWAGTTSKGRLRTMKAVALSQPKRAEPLTTSR